MELILWRHADAEDETGAGDAARRLTRKGRKQAERMAEWLKPRLEGEWRIVVSPAQRTLETIEPLGMPFEVSDAISTAGNARTVLEEARWPDGDRVLVVGHQPTMGEVAAHLLGGGAGEVSVRKGAILWFATRRRGAGEETVLKVVLDPEMLEAVEKGGK
ncbi:MAG TPA: histidine phosphatase family protein [Usitatibacter sp.]|nr:histidine phosphatase family protein [Usitatibacter sp.]